MKKGNWRAKYLSIVLLALSLVVGLGACGGDAPDPVVVDPQAPAEGGETVPEAVGGGESDAPPSDPAWGFKQGLVLALGKPRDYGALASYMGGSFEVQFWMGRDEQLTPADATGALEGILLPPDNDFGFDDEADLQAMLGIGPEELFPHAVDFIFSWGWGAAGEDEAILILGQTPDGDYYWSGILLANGSFATGAGSLSSLAVFRENLIQAWMPGTRDLVYLESVMLDPFFVGGAFAPFYEGVLPVPEALARMEADTLLQSTDPSPVTNDLQAIEREVNYGLDAIPGAVDLVWVGQSDDGIYNVLLVIGQDEEGSLNLISVLAIPVDFKTPGE